MRRQLGKGWIPGSLRREQDAEWPGRGSGYGERDARFF